MGKPGYFNDDDEEVEMAAQAIADGYADGW